MELIGSGFGDGIDDAASRPAVLRALVRRDDGEFLNGIDAQLLARYASGRGIRVTVHGDAIQAVVIHLGPRTRDRNLRPKSTIATVGSNREAWLSVDLRHAGLQGS